MTKNDPRVIVALDFPDMESALGLAARLDPAVCAVKVGKELFTAAGPAIVRALVANGFRVFLDLKYHDIPNTVAQACAAAMGLGVWMLNMHVAGGRAMLVAARDAVAKTAAARGLTRPLLIGVTLLTSLDASDLIATGVAGTADEHVLRLARLAQASGLDGVVCSAREVEIIHAACGSGFKLVTPGIRPAGAATNDQVRVMTPQAAIAAGADYLVIGRAITAAADPLRALRDINASIGVGA
ncbi:MAG: orotidine-5'-phosphate decarboxylase [Casimicrobiaceae bacterium]